ncbi:MAG TPA: molybdopterin-dependent oxidoreductase [Candidatus Limnocylindrales bacterium]|nr:molybdopterin-dependent oxidoreductase [Candidatus Limnocylindrales bacterium]
MKSGRWHWAGAGAAAGAVAIGVGEITAALLGGTSIIAAVGTLVIALQPPGGKDLAVQLFGTNDKLALEIGAALGGILVGALLGVFSRKDVRIGVIGFVAFGAFAFYLLQSDPLSGMVPALASAAAATGAGSVMLTWLTTSLRRPAATGTAAVATSAMGEAQLAATPRPSIDRRGFLALSAMFVAVGGVLAFIGRYLTSQVPAVVADPSSIPAARQTVAPVAGATDFGVEGLTPIVVPNDDFYRIDTRLDVPRVDAATWSLRVHGLVDREVTLTYEQLLAMPLVERYVTIACVSNPVGGRLVGNAKWTGVPLTTVLEQAGVKPEASQLVGRSFDGWTAGFPTEHLRGAGSEALIAVAMNGVPLPPAHGFPARLVVPGLYGYVSATKWITEIELTTLESFDAYWVPLGWSKIGPILTQSRVELPRAGQQLAAGPVQFAGVAWAPTRGINKVEVIVDPTPEGAGTWHQAELSQPLSSTTWVQWRVTLDVPTGEHRIAVRATDGTGETQTSDITPPPPDGARGYHQVTFSAR